MVEDSMIVVIHSLLCLMGISSTSMTVGVCFNEEEVKTV